MAVSIVIPVFNGEATLPACLRSVLAATPAAEEVIVVDDGSTDRSAAVAASFGVAVLRTAGRSGPAAARNLGARKARGEILFFIDADVVIPPDAVAKVRDEFRRQPDVSALIGSYDREPSAPNFLSQYKNLFHHFTHQQAREEGTTFWGACGAVYRDVFEQVDGFHPSYDQASIEDIEFGHRLRANGHRIRVCKDLQVTHLKRWTPRSLVRTDFFCRALPWSRLILQSGRMENDLNTDVSSRVKVALVYALALSPALWWLNGGWLATVAIAATIAAALIALDFKLLHFFAAARGPWFAVRTLPWHWLYYGYCGAAFALAWITTRGKASRQSSTPRARRGRCLPSAARGSSPCPRS